jgi:hypothetical protein
MKTLRWVALASAIVVGMSALGRASTLLDVVGPGINSDTTVANGTTLWSLLVGGVSTSTPAGDNGKNAILRYYVVATGSSGTSVFSLGEIDPAFGGTGAAPYVASSGSSYSLIDPAAGATGRDVSNLTSLRVLAESASSGQRERTIEQR